MVNWLGRIEGHLNDLAFGQNNALESSQATWKTEGHEDFQTMRWSMSWRKSSMRLARSSRATFLRVKQHWPSENSHRRMPPKASPTTCRTRGATKPSSTIGCHPPRNQEKFRILEIQQQDKALLLNKIQDLMDRKTGETTLGASQPQEFVTLRMERQELRGNLIKMSATADLALRKRRKNQPQTFEEHFALQKPRLMSWHRKRQPIYHGNLGRKLRELQENG